HAGPAGQAEADAHPVVTAEQTSCGAYPPLVPPDLPQLLLDQTHQGPGRPGLQSPIDAFVLEKLQAKQLTPNGPASRQELIRRATYDLIGLPPSEEDVAQFVEDTAPDAFSRRLDRLLASPRYGEKWGRHWLDVARYAESNGLDENIAYANAFRYRDYVISSFNSDKPYDRMVQEQIAGDLLPEETGDGVRYGDAFDRYVATGFLAIGAKMLAEDDPMKMQMDIIDEQLSVMCQAFMGMTIGCARCHDHKFDPLPATDYYALAGIFKSTQTMENHNVVARWYERPLATPQIQAEVQAIDKQLQEAKSALAKLNASSAARIADQLQSTISASLQATVLYDRFARQANPSPGRGLNHSDPSGAGYQADLADKPYALPTGYALIEAEGYQRGNVSRDHQDYGKQIGIIGSDGAANVEYDIQVEHAGMYAIELRYAALDRRPLRMLVDGTEVSARVATETSSSWYADGQIWSVAGLIKLTAGKHILRFESRRAFPHVDKLAIVFQAEGEWPFGESPVALSRAGVASSVPFPVIALWRDYLSEIRRSRSDDSTDENLFAFWLKLAEIDGDFPSQVAPLFLALESDTPLQHQTPAVLRQAILAARPESLSAVADVYQSVLQQILDNKDENKDDEAATTKKLREQLLAKASPLAGPQADFERHYSAQERQQADALNSEMKAIEARRPELPMAMGVTEAKPEDLKVHLRGSHLVMGKLAKRRMPQILAKSRQPEINHESSGRLQLAQWMTRDDHPLTSRVMANRLWHWHFGRGIVPSVDNFGLLGLKPSHPELLDWLAIELVRRDWSLKQLHRTLMLSDTYQRSSRYHPMEDNHAGDLNTSQAQRPDIVDAENEWLWRFRRRRLTGEEIRDSVISVGVGLDQTMYGTLMKTENHKYVNSTGGAGELNYDNARRSVYLPIIRSGVFDVLQTLDFPDPAMINGERQTSTVAPQALLMMNSDLVQGQTEALATAISRATLDDAQRISWAYRQILKRPPTLDEIVASSTFVRQARLQSTSEEAERVGWQSLCRVLISSNEFSYVE
ncbi:MAG: DUF1549 domain-containing protein, partial [Pirellulaceae bacterium]|nr:DUF1549 domain-containing protein [Pirellulaceae bacterium]